MPIIPTLYIYASKNVTIHNYFACKKAFEKKVQKTQL
jgi:hypothetical protein